jgi:uncharacterized protein (TIGR02145 family)
MKRQFFILLFLALAANGQQERVAIINTVDDRDGKKYRIVKIGEQTWMAENLNYNAKSSKCYEDNTLYCNKYGRLYNWKTAMKACPKGWHLPSNAEWDRLLHFVDGTSGTASPYNSKTAGKLLKATSGWNDDKGKSGNGTDKYGFSALPGGVGYSSGSFDYAGNYGDWWSSTEYGAYNANGQYMYYGYGSVYWGYYAKYSLHSVRCLQD